MRPRLQDYAIALLQDDNGTFVAYVPAIDGCHAVGATMEEARAGLVEVFEMIVAEYAEEGRDLPSYPPHVSSD